MGQTDLAKWQSSRPLHRMKILDVGCGGGILAEVCVALFIKHLSLFKDSSLYLLIKYAYFYCWFL